MAKIGRLNIPSIAGGARSQDTSGRQLYGNRGSVQVVQPLSAARNRTPEDTIRKNPFMLSPVWRLGLRLGSIPIKVFAFDENGDREEARDHPSYTLLRKPNAKVPRNVMIAGTVAAMFNKKEAFWLKSRDGNGTVTALWPSPHLKPVRDDQGLVGGFELNTMNGPPQPVGFNEVLWFRMMPNWEDWVESVVPMDSLSEIASFSNAAAQAMTDMFDAGFLGRVYVNMHGKVLEQDAAVDVEGTDANPAVTGFLDRFSAQISMARRDKFATPVMEDGATLDPLGGAPNDEVMIRALELADRVVNRTFGFPLDGDLKTFYAEAIQPVADAIEQELERGLMSEWPNQPAFPEFQFRELLKGNEQEIVESHARAILTMQETPNEARRDRNRRPLPGGDTLFGPLNLGDVALLTGSNQRPEKDSADGPGGGPLDGQDSTVAADKEPVAPQAAMGGAEVIQMRAVVTNKWKEQRTRTIRRHGEAFSQRAQGLLRKEAARIREVIEAPAIVRMRAAGIPPQAELLGQVGAADDDLAKYLNQFMKQAGSEAWEQAEEMIGAEQRAVASGLREVYAERTAAVVNRFSTQRVDALNSLFERSIEQHLTTPQLADEVTKLYGGMAQNIADGIGRTETAFAYEKAAMASWGQAGVQEMEYVDGGGPCSTGICHSAAGVYRMGVDRPGDIGYSFEGAQAPPLHPSCTCFVVPAVRGQEIAEAPPGTETPATDFGSNIPQGDVEDIRTLGGGVTSTYRGRIGDYNVMLKPQSGLRNEVMRGGIPPAADLSREAAAAIVNQELALVNMPAVEVRAVRYEVSEEAKQFFGLKEWDDSVVMEFVDDSKNIMDVEARGFAGLEGEELHRLSLFDSIIGNMDRHGGNGMMGPSREFWAIDHGLSFPDPVKLLADTDFHGWGNYWAQAETVGQTVTEAEMSTLRSFLARRTEVSERLRKAGLEEGAINGLWGRVQRLIENGVLPDVPARGDASAWLSAGS